jgi:hypothetical protein
METETIEQLINKPTGWIRPACDQIRSQPRSHRRGCRV